MDNNGPPNDYRATDLTMPARARTPESSSRDPGLQTLPTASYLLSKYPSIQDVVTEGLRNGEMMYILTQLRDILFDENDVKSYFEKVELQFRFHGITKQYTRFLFLITSVPASVIYLASGGRIGRKDPNCYDNLKRGVLNIYRRPIDDLDNESFTLTEFGSVANLTPDQAHDIVIKLYGPAPLPPLRATKWKYAFMSLLGESVKSYLIKEDGGKSLTDLVKMAHELNKTLSSLPSSDNIIRSDATPRNSAERRTKKVDDKNARFTALIDGVTKLLKYQMSHPMNKREESDLEIDTGTIVKAMEMLIKLVSNPYKNEHPKSKSNKAKADKYELCWYHHRYGNKANRCVSVGNRCQWEATTSSNTNR